MRDRGVSGQAAGPRRAPTTHQTARTRRSGQTYEQYIAQVAGNAIARPVKLADLADNLANNKRLTTRPDVVARIERHEPAIRWWRAPDVPS